MLIKQILYKENFNTKKLGLTLNPNVCSSLQMQQ